MRWRRRCGAAIGVVVALTYSPPVGRADWLTLTSGVRGSSDPTAASEFWFDSPHAPPVVAVTQVTDGGTVRATTGGGTTYFGGLGTPVLLNLAGGSAYLAGGDPPAGATGRGPGGGSAGPLSSAAPQAGGSVPSGAALLGLGFAGPGGDGSRGLTATVTDGGGTVLGTGTLAVPDGGWWVVGLGPGRQPASDPGPGDPTPEPVPDPPPGTVPGVPEPAAVALIASGVAAVVLPPLRRRRYVTTMRPPAERESRALGI
ncbi:MAG TPA: hypothetical protein VH092_29960 [Urbifossiella sp.]|nr:hypothetical protein [Urbifossiella sp.]